MCDYLSCLAAHRHNCGKLMFSYPPVRGSAFLWDVERCYLIVQGNHDACITVLRYNTPPLPKGCLFPPLRQHSTNKMPACVYYVSYCELLKPKRCGQIVCEQFLVTCHNFFFAVEFESQPVDSDSRSLSSG